MNEQNICKINETFVKGNKLNMKNIKKMYYNEVWIMFLNNL